jgi:hypothetical protein
MKKLLLILLFIPLFVIGQREYTKLYVDTTNQSYVINDSIRGEMYKIRHVYAYDTVLMIQDIERFTSDFEQRQAEKADMIKSYNQELTKIYRKRQRLIRILTKLRE